ncbi:citrulline utilization hydrolase CtlX [Pedobacter sp. JCM 36344]|uniref:citrulline utilization hydrolase CtlX n=1 Tax=Pedobacter sp. JCM 36344 TaxID=3374280 RepID=UPI003978916F
MQTTSHLLMIRPVDFKFNQETASNNKFQQKTNDDGVQLKALLEFDAFVTKLRENDIDVTVISDTLDPETPDSIFPNNWISFHEDGKVVLYPMFSKNRRLERRKDILEELNRKFIISELVDLSTHELNNSFLEGTGSLVLDRNARIAYACRSLRTDEKVIADFCEQTGYSIVLFNGIDQSGFPIYHTNVMMCIADQFAVICLNAIPDLKERDKVVVSLKHNEKDVIDITLDQMNHFAGNMLQVENKKGELLLVMSEQAFNSLSEEQIGRLAKYNKIVNAPIYNIEKHGGGSARCMLAEIHLNER